MGRPKREENGSIARPLLLLRSVDMIVWKGQNLAYFLGVEIERGMPVPKPSVNYSCKFDAQPLAADPVCLTITPRARSAQRDKRQVEKGKGGVLLRDIVVRERERERESDGLTRRTTLLFFSSLLFSLASPLCPAGQVSPNPRAVAGAQRAALSGRARQRAGGELLGRAGQDRREKPVHGRLQHVSTAHAARRL